MKKIKLNGIAQYPQTLVAVSDQSQEPKKPLVVGILKNYKQRKSRSKKDQTKNTNLDRTRIRNEIQHN